MLPVSRARRLSTNILHIYLFQCSRVSNVNLFKSIILMQHDTNESVAPSKYEKYCSIR